MSFLEVLRGADPPLLTGGSSQNQCVSRSVDFLTLTASSEVGAELMRQNPFSESGGACRGFSKSEARLCIGGQCWRRWEPFQPSKSFGLAYESWEWAGSVAMFAADAVARFDVRPSRVDVAYDFACGVRVMADDVAGRCEAWMAERGIKGGVSGEGEINTRYIGSRLSERRIRIYRKDLESDVLAELLGPLMRIELVLKNDHARAWWKVWCRSREDAFAAAAAHVHQMSGMELQALTVGVPEFVKPDAADEAQSLFQFIKQHGDRVGSWIDAGVDLVALVNEHREQSISRKRAFRAKARGAAMQSAGVDEVTQLVRLMLNPKVREA